MDREEETKKGSASGEQSVYIGKTDKIRRSRATAPRCNEAQANQMEWTRRNVVEERASSVLRSSVPWCPKPGQGPG